MDKYSDYLEKLIKFSKSKYLIYSSKAWTKAIDRMKELESENAKLKQQLDLIHNESRELGQKCVKGTCEHNAYSLMLRRKDRDINKIKADAIREATSKTKGKYLDVYCRFNDLEEYADKVEKGEIE